MKNLTTAEIRAVARAVQDLMPPSPQEAPFGLGAPWTCHADQAELDRLAKLHTRIRRKEKALADLRAERHRIMARCIRRGRRADGKD